MCADCNWEQFTEDCEALLFTLGELPDRAEEFRESVTEKTEDMRDWAEEKEHVTDKMKVALENMSQAASNWVSW